MPETDIEIPRRGIFLRKLWALAWPYFWSEEKWVARGLLAAVVVLTLGGVLANVLVNYWYKYFYDALQAKDEPRFWRLLLIFCAIAAPAIIAAVYSNYLQQMLQIRWRRWMTENLMRHWLENQSYYRMQLRSGGTDNPEQRIEQDVSLFTDGALNLSLGLLNSVVTLFSFVGILWTISGPLRFTLAGHAMVIPGYMVWAAVLYAGIGSWLTYKIGRVLIRTNFRLQRANASFRFGMSRLRENAESVAFYGGEETERQELMSRFASIWRFWWDLMRQQKRLNWFTNGYTQIALIFPFVVAAPRYFIGAIQLGDLMQIVSAFGQVQGALSWFISNFADNANLSGWKATIDRLTGFVDTIEEAGARTSGIVISPSPSSALKTEGLTLALPDGRVLVHQLDADIRASDKVLVSGPSGAGKTTLFRALAGIWPFGSGRIQRPSSGHTLFLPQRPYLPIGTLREAVAYPAETGSYGDEAIRAALGDVNLEQLRDRLDEKQNWSMALSIGEQQRLAIARALLLKPDWLFLDEATSALDGPNEQRMYALLAERLPDATVLSIAHRPEIARYHTQRLKIDPDAHTATLSPISAA